METTMSSFPIELTNPLPEGFTVGLGGPGQGGHTGPHWYEAAGNDLGAPAGTPVHALFAGRVSTVDRTAIGATSGKVYGAGIFVRAAGDGLDPSAPDGVGAYYTHVTLDPAITEGTTVDIGQIIGDVVEVAGIPPHVHLAIAVRTADRYTGVDIYEQLEDTAGTTDPFTLVLSDDGTPAATPEEEHDSLVEQEN
jgi:murein DD-endopeptidase MepM/ murein hydrolase activator NlpD